MQVSGHPVKVAVCGVDPAAAEGSTRWLRARERGESQAGQAEWGAGVGASSHPTCGKPAESPLLPAGISPAHPEPQLAGLHLPESWNLDSAPSCPGDALVCAPSAWHPGQDGGLGPSSSYFSCLRLCSCPNVTEDSHSPPRFLHRLLPCPPAQQRTR